MSVFRKIGPHLGLRRGEILRMQDAIETDLECGCHWMANEKADRMNKEFPTIIAMAGLIEQERDSLRRRLRQIQRRNRTKGQHEKHQT